jgi:glycosyltransferase involved in cell wall biosynthesis
VIVRRRIFAACTKAKKVIVVLPAYRAALTLKQTYEEIPFDLVDDVVLVDDKSPDNTVEVARQLGIRHVVLHRREQGLRRQSEELLRQGLGAWWRTSW